jgi:hypothetical protein
MSKIGIFRTTLGKIVEQEKLKVNTYQALADITGVSATTLKDMVTNKHDVRLDNVLSVLEATGYDLKIERKKEIT